MRWMSLLLCFGLALAQSYSVERVEQDVFFLPDGSVRVEEAQTLRFDGDFRGNRYWIRVEPAPAGSVRFLGVEAEDGRTVAWEARGNELEWAVAARDETRTFLFAYALEREVEVAEDAAQFDRMLLTNDHEGARAYLLRLHPPAPSPEGFRVFIFTGLGRIGTLDFADDYSLATVALAPVAEGEFVRARVILDAAPFAVQTQEGLWEERWLREVDEETRGFREESARQLEQPAPFPPPSNAWLWLVWGGVAALGLWLGLAYRAFGREPEVEDVGPYYREPAEEIPPAAVPFVITQRDPGLQAASPAIAATLLDFARRGFLAIHTEDSPRFLGLGRSQSVFYRLLGDPLLGDPEGLTPFEAELWGAFRGAARGAPSNTLGGLLQTRPQGPNRDPAVFDAGDLRRFFEARPSFGRAWILQPRRWYEQTHGKLLDAASSGRAAAVMGGCALAAVLFGFGAFSFFGAYLSFGLHLALAAGIAALLGVVARFSLERWKADKLLNARRWAAYRRFLSDFSLMNEAPAEHYKLWDYHFVYATALGVSREYLKNLQELMKREPDKFVTPPWLVGNRGLASGGLSTLGNVEALSRSLNTLSQVETNLGNLNQALSPQAKTGGGFGGSSSGGGFSRGGGFSGGSRGGGGGRGMR